MAQSSSRALMITGLFGGAVLAALGVFFIWVTWTGLVVDGDPAYFLTIMVLGVALLVEGGIVWRESRLSTSTDTTDGYMLVMHGIVLIALTWLVVNVERVVVISIRNGEVYLNRVDGSMVYGIYILMALAIWDAIVRIKRIRVRATLNTPSCATGPDAGP